MFALVAFHGVGTVAARQSANLNRVDVACSPHYLHSLVGALFGTASSAVDEKHPDERLSKSIEVREHKVSIPLCQRSMLDSFICLRRLGPEPSAGQPASLLKSF